MALFRLSTGIVEFDLPTATELVEENGPMFGHFRFKPHQYVFYILQTVDLSGVDDFADSALYQALDEGEQLEHTPTDRSAIFRDPLSVRVSRRPTEEGRYFLRIDRLDNDVARILKISPGRSDGEAQEERDAMDELGRQVAASAKFSRTVTGVDRAAGRPGTTILHIPNRILCPLPIGWTVHEMEEIDPDWAPDPDGGEAVVCLGPDERASMFVSVESLVRDDPGSDAELAEEISEMWEHDRDDIAGMDKVGPRVDGTVPESGRYLFRGDFDAARLGVEGRHYVLRAFGPRQMVTVQMTPILTDEDGGPKDAARLLDPVDDCIRRAHVLLRDD